MPDKPVAVLPFWAAIVVALASGPILDAGFPDKSVWPMTFVGIALVLIALRGRSSRGAFLVGFLGGMAFYLTHISWASLFLGPVPMLALSFLESLFVALGGLAITLAYRWLPRAFGAGWGATLGLAVVVSGLWTAREAWMSVWPYGGFSWGRVALSQSESPLAALFPWLGVSGVSFVMVLVVALSLAAAEYTWRHYRELPLDERAQHLSRALRTAFVPVTVVTLLLNAPSWHATLDGTLRVGAVQGNGKAAYFDERDRGDLLQAQLTATEPLYGQDLDLVVWPEGGTDLSPLSNSYAAAAFDYVVDNANAPLISGDITERDGNIYNSQLLWMPGEGVVDIYDKRHPVPFGEYVPNREIWEQFAPDLIGLIGRDYSIGSTDMVFDVNGVTLGVNICFDIVDDQILTESVEEGAQLIIASSNNADFGRTDESAQQLAMARIRALELGRSVVNISTVGLSAIIAPDGTTIAEVPWYTAATMVEDVPLSTSITPAVVWGRELEWLVSGIGLGALIVAAVAGRRKNA
ncbi:apolipoprotein N-acyltransferase [Salinibacterium sp. SWN248]|uniref:apolipoprotein N-acyltransferase n=1 Tax=Salinibacterium sp. SWN248 TaxID=2792056 RepID=UPI0018CE9BA5|nr:apolipoprotein N-acyltransferase [Salinibacterium sp. SWN248]MBH0024223.1 apolipoprotein N-acyltransferase [Salinibacterium sp. SWN248]